MRNPLVLTSSIALLLTSACAATQATVILPEPPRAAAPLVERDAYYEAKKPLGIAGAPDPVNQLGWLAPATFPVLVLADGTKVADPTSLLPAVASDSVTAKSARKVGELRFMSSSVYTVSSLALSVGLTTLLLAPVVIASFDPTAALSVTLLGTVGSVAGAFGVGWATQLAAEAETEKMAALMLYETDLRRRLALVRPDELLDKKWVHARQPSPALAPVAGNEEAPATVPITPLPAPSEQGPPGDPSEPPSLLNTSQP